MKRLLTTIAVLALLAVPAQAFTPGYLPYFTAAGFTDSPIYTDGTDVGIGTTAPGRKLQVEDTTANVAIRLRTGTALDALIDFGDTDDGDVGQIGYDHATNTFTFKTATSAQVEVDGSGNTNLYGPTLDLIPATGSATTRIESNDDSAVLTISADENDTATGSSQDPGLYLKSADTVRAQITVDESQARLEIGAANVDVLGIHRNAPSSSQYIDSAGDATFGGSIEVGDFLSLGTATELTIASGAVTASRSLHTIDTEADAGTDDVDTINGVGEGFVVCFNSADSGRDTTFTEAGNLNLAGGSFTLTGNRDRICLIGNAASSLDELLRSNNN